MSRAEVGKQESGIGNCKAKDGGMTTGKWTLLAATMAGLLWAGGARAGNLNPASAPGPTMYTLEEIYQQLLATQQQVLSNQQALAEIRQLLAATVTYAYMVVDVSGGPSATDYPVSYLSAVPGSGWTDEYKTTKIVFHRILAGAFTMGSPTNELGRYDDETQHQVTLTADFYLGVFQLTQRQWELVMGNKPSYFSNAVYYATRPVERVSYCDIRGDPAAANWPADSNVVASSFMGLLRAKTGLAFDLPTESQWEYACRAGTATALNSGQNLTVPYGNDPQMNVVGRYNSNNGLGDVEYGDASSGTAKVGSYQANAWGLYDMHGNVWEWCLDWYGVYPPGTVTDPQGCANSWPCRVGRGGSWSDAAHLSRSASRGIFLMGNQISIIGFRVCCAPPSQQ